MTDDEKLVHNERTKITATWLNGLAIALAAIGGFAPLVSYLSSSIAATSVLTLRFTALTCLVGSFGLTFVRRSPSGEIESMTSLELLMIFGVPGMFLAVGLVGYVIAKRESDRFDRSRLRPGE